VLPIVVNTAKELDDDYDGKTRLVTFCKYYISITSDEMCVDIRLLYDPYGPPVEIRSASSIQDWTRTESQQMGGIHVTGTDQSHNLSVTGHGEMLHQPSGHQIVRTLSSMFPVWQDACSVLLVESNTECSAHVLVK